MRIHRRAGYWLWVGGPVPPGANGVTFGRLVIVRSMAAGSARLLRHELGHVRQFARFGFTGFLPRYIAGYGAWRIAGYPHRGAYRRIPFEIEAEWEARRRPDLAPADLLLHVAEVRQ